MYKRLVYTAIIFSVFSLFAFPQNVKLASEENPQFRYIPLKGGVFFKDYRQVKGNPYTTDDWANGDIQLINGEELLSVKYKFDAYAHDLLVYNEYVKRVVYLEGEKIDKFILNEGGRSRNYKRIESDKVLRIGNKNLLMEVLFDDQISLYKLYFRDILPLRIPEMPFIEEFANGINYYIYYQGKYETAHLRKSYALSKFPEYKIEIKQYIRKNKLKLRNEDHFAQLISYISSLSTNSILEE